MLTIPSLWRVLGILLLIAPASAAITSISISSDTDLQSALVDDSIQEIVVEQDITLERDHWVDWYSRQEPFVRSTNLTIRGFPPLRKLDLAFTGDGRLQLAAGVFLNISNIILEHARYGAGVQLDFLGASPGSYVVLWNSVIMRMACISSTREPDAVAVQPRLPGFPGQQRAHYKDGYCVRRNCYDNVLVYEDYTRITGTNTEDTAAGGYAMIMHNLTKVCMKYIDACDPSFTVDDCVRQALDATSELLTPGQIEHAQQAADRQRKNNAIIGAVVGAFCGTVLLLVAAWLLLRQMRRRRRAEQNGQKLLPAVHATAASDSTRRPDLELGIVDSHHSNSPAHPKALVSSGTPPNTHNSWELAACKTSERFLHLQPQHSHHNSSSTDVQQHWLPGNGATGNWYMRAPGSSSTNVVQSHDGPPSTADLIAGNTAGNDKVTLGILLGAGSFGRVYKGKWRGLDVAVKVLQHSRAAAASVANEVDLMMSFQHPNVVSAHHFVSWRKRQPPKIDNFDAEANGDQDRVGSWAAALDNGFADTAGPTGEYPEDTQTWIVQEFCDAGNLCEYLSSRRDWQQGQLPESHNMLRLLFRLREVADGMSYLHNKTVVHGDLKSGNVLLTVSPTSPYGRTAKITDFGLSRAMATGQTHRSTHTLGTVSHMAPELLRYGKMAPPCDVFSFGIMMWELLTGRVAFSGLHYGAIIERVALMGERPAVPPGTPEDFSLLMCSCWSADPEQRPTFDQVMRCLDIMITSRQQELAVAKSGSTHNNSSSNSFDTQQMPSSGHPSVAIVQQAPQVGVSSSSGEFDMTVSTRGFSSGRYGKSGESGQLGGNAVSDGSAHSKANGNGDPGAPFEPQDL